MKIAPKFRNDWSNGLATGVITDIECPKCGRFLVVKVASRGNKFLGCQNFPQCNGSSSIPVDGVPFTMEYHTTWADLESKDETKEDMSIYKLGGFNMRVVRVNFDDYASSSYVFKCDLDEVVVGSLVVVDTVNGYRVATVIEILDEVPNKATKWVVDMLDLAKHEERLAKEKNLRIIKKKMDERRKKLEDIAVYQILAKEDEEMAKLLEEFSELGK